MTIHFSSTSQAIMVSDSSYRYRSIMGENSLTVSFSLDSHLEIPVGAWAMFQNERYELTKPVRVKKVSSQHFDYQMVLEGSQSRLKRYILKDTSTQRVNFSLTARPVDHLRLLVDNLNERDEGWTVGECLDAVEKHLPYNHAYCYDALQSIASSFDTEWEIIGKTIHLRKVERNRDNPLALSYGRGNGFKSGITRASEKEKVVERLYLQTSEQNIDPSTYGSRHLLLPKSQRLTYQGRVYESDANGYYIQRADKPLRSQEEASVDLSHILATREGRATAVEAKKPEKNFYDIIDGSIPEALNFERSLIKGESMSIIFNSGLLAGKEFEVLYRHAERRFEIVPQEYDGMTLPNQHFTPAVGDTYGVFGIMLPPAYLSDNDTQTGASWELFREAARYLHDNEDPKFTFTGEMDGIWAKRNWLNIGGRIALGSYVQFTDADIVSEPSLVRIVGIREYINNPHSPTLDLSNVTQRGSFALTLAKIGEKDLLIEESRKAGRLYTQRQFRQAQETIKLLDGSVKGFSSGVTPLTVSTMQLLAGDESLQLRFVSSKSTPRPVAHLVAFNQATKRLTADSGIIQHMTLGISTIKPSHLANEYRFWDVPPFESSLLDNPERPYYLYAKAARQSAAATFELSEAPISLESVPGYYHLLLGILNSEIDGERSFARLYGFSELLPGRLTTDVIASSDGGTYFDLISGIISGRITFKAGTSGLGNISEWSEAAQDIEEAQQAANEANRRIQETQDFIDNVLPADLQALQNQIDGQIESFFFSYDPTLGNHPASQWATASEREKHLNDTFTNTSTGASWRFSKSGSTYTWTAIADTATTKALALAGQAKDTADRKRRTFVVQPTPPYEAGDLWAQGTAGELMRCIVPRLGGSFVASDWGPATKYTDDTAVNNLQIGGRNLLLNSDFKHLDGNTYTIISPYDTGPYIYSLSKDTSNKLDGYNSLKIVGTSAGNLSTNGYRFFFKMPNNFALNTNYILSFYVKASPACNVSARSFWGSLESGGAQAVTTSFQKVSLSIRTASQADVFFALCFDKAVTAYICKPKLEMGTRATDWTPAVEDVQTDIYYAQQAANAANSAIASVTSDNVLSAAEKPSERLRWNDIASEKAGINAQAAAYAIAAESTAYNTAFQALATYLNAGTAWASGVPSWISDANIARDTAIVGATYRQKWNDYYSTKQSLLNAIYAKAKSLADTAQSKADLLEASLSKSAFADTFNETQAQFNLRWTSYAGGGNPTITPATDATGGNFLRVGDNSGNDMAWLVGNTSIPFDPNRLYLIKARVRKTAGAGFLYVGIAGRDASDTQFVNTSGENSHAGQHYVCISGLDVGSVWVEYVGYFKGWGGIKGGANNPLDPGGLHANVRHIRPVVIANYSGAAGITEIDYVAIDYAEGIAAMATAEGIRVGGRNLLSDSSFEKGSSFLLKTNSLAMTRTSEKNKQGGYAMKGSNFSSANLFYIFKTVDTESMLSFYAFSSTSKQLVMAQTPSATWSWANTQTTSLPAGAWTRVEYPLLARGYDKILIGLTGSYASSDALYVDAFKLESGNRATDWTPAPEDVDAAIDAVNTAASARALELEARTKGLSGIEGGLLFSNILKLNQLNGDETAGLSGIPSDGSGNVLPAMWVGGSYAQALNQDTNFVVMHDGSMRAGNLHIEPAGVVKIKDEAGVDRVELREGSIDSLASLLGQSSAGTIENSYRSYSSDKTETLPNRLDVQFDGTKVNIIATLTAFAHADSGGRVGCSIHLSLTDEQRGKSYSLGRASAGDALLMYPTDQPAPIEDLRRNDRWDVNTELTLQKGTYSLVVDAIFYGSDSSGCSISSSKLTWSYNPAIRKTVVGTNGLFTYLNRNNYLYAAVEGNELRISMRGKMEMDGVLLAGRISSFGGVDRIWGPRSANIGVAKLTSNVYRITHSWGHDDYFLVGVPRARYQNEFESGLMANETANYVDITIMANQFVVANSFNFIIVGRY